MLDGSPTGVGTWGDPANDYQISNGGFKNLTLAYPSPHHIRRNFSLFPFTNPDLPPLFTGQTPPKELMVNTTMTKENVDRSVNGFEGDFIGFHAYVESPGVSSTPPPLGFVRPDPSV